MVPSPLCYNTLMSFVSRVHKVAIDMGETVPLGLWGRLCTSVQKGGVRNGVI